MTDDPLSRWLADRVDAAVPDAVPAFDVVRRRARRDRVRRSLAVAAGVVAVAGVSLGSWALGPSERAPGPDRPGPASTSPSAGPTSSRPDPTFTRSRYPSGLVLRLPERDVDLPADSSCWAGPRRCHPGLLEPDETGPDAGRHDTLDFWFARPGWRFEAVLRRVGESCPRATTVGAVGRGDQWFRLAPADRAGRYLVELRGRGPEGFVSSRFLWTTTTDGPVDPPRAALALFPGSAGPGSFALEVTVDDLPFQPTVGDLSRTVEVSVTSADGRQRTLTAPLVRASLDCAVPGSRGSYYYQAEWGDDIASLGSSPVTLEAELAIRGTRYTGRATWGGMKDRGDYLPLELSPPLPRADAD